MEAVEPSCKTAPALSTAQRETMLYLRIIISINQTKWSISQYRKIGFDEFGQGVNLVGLVDLFNRGSIGSYSVVGCSVGIACHDKSQLNPRWPP